jgi:putative ABC transport system permease protein
VTDTVRVGASALWALPLLVAAAAVLAGVARTWHGAAVVAAAARAVMQLALVGTVVAIALGSLRWSAVALIAMTLVASLTSARRLRPLPRVPACAAVAIAVPTASVLALLLVSGALPPRAEAVLPAGGIIVGGAMTATTLTGRRLLADIRQRHGEIDAALAVGLEPRQAIGEIAGRQAAAEPLIPALDQTRNVGLVTLPGAFVGMILGGAPPAQAAMVQLVVLIALLTTEAAAALLTAELVAGACSCGTASVVVPQVINET